MSDHAIANAKAWLENIRAMVARLNSDETRDEAQDEINQAPLCVEVRGGWYSTGAVPGEPEEFSILLTTGGPALRIYGTLGMFAQPEHFELQWQDWGEPWTDYTAGDEDDDAALRTFVEQFYFGEG